MYFWNWIDRIIIPFARLFSWLGRVVPFGRRLAKLSPAGWLALAVFLGLLLFTLFAAIKQYRLEDSLVGMYFNHQLVIWLIVACLIVVPLAVYWGVALLTFSQPKLYPEIDEVWERGLEFLAKNHLELADVPLILVLGSADYDQFQGFHHRKDQGEKGGSIASNPRDWLYWGVEKDCLYLHLGKCCHMASFVAGQAGSAAKGPMPLGTLQVDDSLGGNDDSWDPQGSLDPLMGTQKLSDSGVLAASLAVDPSTLSPDAEEDFLSTGSGDLPAVDSDSLFDAALAEDDQAADRMNYLFRLIRTAAPRWISPHGLVIRVHRTVMEDPVTFSQAQHLLTQDLLTIHRGLETTLPITLLFTGFERDKGFLNLSEALGRKAAAQSRFGVGCEPTEIPDLSPENFEALANRLVDYVEGHLLKVMRSSKQLHQPKKNRELFKFGAWIRNRFAPRLKALLTQTLLHKQLDADPTFLLSGCYLGTISAAPDEVSFIEGIKQKILRFSEVADWAQRRRMTNRWQLLFGSLLGLAALVSVGLLVAFIAGVFTDTGSG